MTGKIATQYFNFKTQNYYSGSVSLWTASNPSVIASLLTNIARDGVW